MAAQKVMRQRQMLEKSVKTYQRFSQEFDDACMLIELGDAEDDAATVTERIESAVGRDLQFIRINGTLVGGLVGVAIHTLDVLL